MGLFFWGNTLTAGGPIIFDNGPPDQSSAGFSDFDVSFGFAQQRADDFALAPGQNTIGDVHWYGVYGSANTPGVDNFTIRIFSDAGGTPGVNPIEEINVGDVGRMATGNLLFTLDEFEYWTEIDPISLAANTTFWLSIVNDTPTDIDDNWAWSTSSGFGFGNGVVRAVDGGAWTHDPFELAFNLTGVPEPTSILIWSLLGLAIAGVGYYRIRRMK